VGRDPGRIYSASPLSGRSLDDLHLTYVCIAEWQNLVLRDLRGDAVGNNAGPQPGAKGAVGGVKRGGGRGGGN
jgi:hypothetical protein